MYLHIENSEENAAHLIWKLVFVQHKYYFIWFVVDVSFLSSVCLSRKHSYTHKNKTHTATAFTHTATAFAYVRVWVVFFFSSSFLIRSLFLCFSIQFGYSFSAFLFLLFFPLHNSQLSFILSLCILMLCCCFANICANSIKWMAMLPFDF